MPDGHEMRTASSKDSHSIARDTRALTMGSSMLMERETALIRFCNGHKKARIRGLYCVQQSINPSPV
jgi:hypothetical protein